MGIKEYKRFIRFLKEKGLYSAFYKDCEKCRDRRYKCDGRMPLNKYIKKFVKNAEAIMELINWHDADFKGWQNVYNEYKIIYYNNEEGTEFF